jgi:amidase
MPAAWCGLVGLKPSRGRISNGPESIDRAGVEFVVARSVRDVAALLDEVHGNEPGDLYLIAPPIRSYFEEQFSSLKGLRVGILTHCPALEVHPECAEGTRAAGRLLESLGHAVDESWPKALFEQDTAYSPRLGVVGIRMMRRYLEGMLGRPLVECDVEPALWRGMTIDAPVSADEWIEYQERRQKWVASVAAWWAGGFDLLLTPTVYEPPVLLSELTAPAEKPWRAGMRTLQHSMFTLPFNITGQPAISLPLHWSSAGLPIGIQLVAAMGREDLLLSVAAELERSAPWKERRPLVHA